MTQFERTKAMSLEELAEEMNSADYCESFCEYCEKGTGLCRTYESGRPMYECCVEAAIKYLKSEV